MILGVLNSSITDFFIKHVGVVHGSGYYKFEDRFIKNFPIKQPKTPKERQLATQIATSVEQILSQVEVQQRTEQFPDSYLKPRDEIELNELTHTFTTNHNTLHPTTADLLDGGFAVAVGEKEGQIPVETRARADFLITALTGKKVKKGEKCKVLIPKDEHVIHEILQEYKNDKKQLEEFPISRLELEIDELVYELYGLDDNDRTVIEEFLQKF